MCLCERVCCMCVCGCVCVRVCAHLCVCMCVRVCVCLCMYVCACETASWCTMTGGNPRFNTQQLLLSFAPARNNVTQIAPVNQIVLVLPKETGHASFKYGCPHHHPQGIPGALIPSPGEDCLCHQCTNFLILLGST